MGAEVKEEKWGEINYEPDSPAEPWETGKSVKVAGIPRTEVTCPAVWIEPWGYPGFGVVSIPKQKLGTQDLRRKVSTGDTPQS